MVAQTWLLFHNALSEGVVIDDILKYARMNKEMAGLDDDARNSDSELRSLVQAQAAELELLKRRVSRLVRGVLVWLAGWFAGSVGNVVLRRVGIEWRQH